MPLARYFSPLAVEPALSFVFLSEWPFQFLFLNAQFRHHSRNLRFHRKLPGFELPFFAFDFFCALFFFLPVFRFLGKPGSTVRTPPGPT